MDNGTFEIKFEDKTTFIGNLFQKDWNKISETKKIKEIIFSFGNRIVKMEEFQAYNLTYETHMIIGKGGKIVNITLAGREENRSILLIYDLGNGKILRKEVDKYKEYGNWISSTWKNGIIKGTPKTYYG